MPTPIVSRYAPPKSMRQEQENAQTISPVVATYLESVVTHTITTQKLQQLRSARSLMTSAENRVYAYLEDCIKQKRVSVK